MNKNIIRVIALTICILTLGTMCYATQNSETFVAQFLIDTGVLQGYPDGDLKLGNTITREEFAKIIVYVSPYKNSLNLMSYSSPFCDVLASRWSAPYVKVAAENNILQGYPDGEFKPTNNIKLEEGVVIALRSLNYTSKEYGTAWPYSQIAFAQEKNLLENINLRPGQNLTRKDAINLIYNTLRSQVNGTNITYMNLIDYTKISNVTFTSSREFNKNMASDKVLTSMGEYTAKYAINNEAIGYTGDLILNLDGDMVAFVPRNFNMKEYVLNAILQNGIAVNEDGTKTTFEIPSDTKAYYMGGTTTLGKLANVVSSGSRIRIFMDNSNKVEYVIVFEQDCRGPFVIENANWMNTYGVNSNYVITDGNKNLTSKDVKVEDVIYVYDDAKEVRVYSDKVSGIITQMLPSKANVTSILINGENINIEEAKVYTALQEYNEGDAITLLLGKDGIVDISSNSSRSNNIVGILLNAGTEILENTNGKYTAKFIDVLQANGKVTHYTVEKDYKDKINDVVNVSIGKNVSLFSVSTSKMSGKVDATKHKIGSYTVAANANILEVPEVDKKYIPVTSKLDINRIDGINLATSNVICYTRNSNGEIDNLILTDVTNDMYSYGILLNKVDLLQYSNNCTYTVLLNGNIITAYSQDISFNAEKDDPVAMLISNGQVLDMVKLKKLDATIKDISIGKVKTSKGDYILFSNVEVYDKNSKGEYILNNLNNVIDEDISSTNMKIYYTKDLTNGGKIALIIY